MLPCTHLAHPAIPVGLEGLVQRVEDERERMLLTGREGSAEGLLQVGLRDAGPIEEVSAFDEFGEGRAGGYARRTAVDLIADLFEDVLRDPDRKAGDVAAGGVAGLAPAGSVSYLPDVARADEVVYYLLAVTIGHDTPPSARVERGDLS